MLPPPPQHHNRLNPPPQSGGGRDRQPILPAIQMLAIILCQHCSAMSKLVRMLLREKDLLFYLIRISLLHRRIILNWRQYRVRIFQIRDGIFSTNGTDTWNRFANIFPQNIDKGTLQISLPKPGSEFVNLLQGSTDSLKGGGVAWVLIQDG
jgi:hypothetical protein